MSQHRFDYVIRRACKGRWVLFGNNGTRLGVYSSRSAAYCTACLLLGRGPGSITVEKGRLS